MRGGWLAALALTAVVVGGGAWFAWRTEPALDQAGPGRLAFPDFINHVADAHKVVLRQDGKTVTLLHGQRGWGIEEKHLYPVPTDKLRALFAGLADLRLSEARTDAPAQYSRLGVEDPGKPGAGGVEVQVFAASGPPLVSLIVGHRREARGGAGGASHEEVFVRRPDEARSWLADGHLETSADVSSWFGHDLLNISRNRISAVEVTRPDGTLSFTVKDGKATLEQPAEHGPLDPNRLDDVARGLEYLTLSDVTVADHQPGKTLADTVFHTKDGLVVRAHVTGDGPATWVSLGFSGKGQTEAEAATMNEQHGGWAFHVGDWKRAALTPDLKDLLAAVKPEAATAPPAAAPAPASTPVKTSP